MDHICDGDGHGSKNVSTKVRAKTVALLYVYPLARFGLF